VAGGPYCAGRGKDGGELELVRRWWRRLERNRKAGAISRGSDWICAQFSDRGGARLLASEARSEVGSHAR